MGKSGCFETRGSPPQGAEGVYATAPLRHGGGSGAHATSGDHATHEDGDGVAARSGRPTGRGSTPSWNVARCTSGSRGGGHRPCVADGE